MKSTPPAGGDLPLEIDVVSVKGMLDAGDDFVLLDCRGEDEHQTASIDAAMLLPMQELPDRVGELESHRDRHIVVHCHHGGRSMRVTEWLRGNGFPRVQSMAGGIEEWSNQVDSGVPRY
ncbi:MAG: rhodanese-like domain-containing protein [Planctomycetota bacterium]